MPIVQSLPQIVVLCRDPVSRDTCKSNLTVLKKFAENRIPNVNGATAYVAFDAIFSVGDELQGVRVYALEVLKNQYMFPKLVTYEQKKYECAGVETSRSIIGVGLPRSVNDAHPPIISTSSEDPLTPDWEMCLQTVQRAATGLRMLDARWVMVDVPLDDGVGEAVEHGIALNTREPIHVKVVVDALRKFAKHNGIEDIEYKTWADEFPGIMRIMTVLSILERLTLGIVVALQMVIVAAILIVILSLKRARFVLLEVMAVDRSWIYGQVGKVILFFSSVGLIVGAFSAVLITMSLEGFLRSRRGMLQVGELNGEFAAAFDPLTVVLTIAAFLLCIVFSSAATISVWLRKVPAVEIREVGSA